MATEVIFIGGSLDSQRVTFQGEAPPLYAIHKAGADGVILSPELYTRGYITLGANAISVYLGSEVSEQQALRRIFSGTYSESDDAKRPAGELSRSQPATGSEQPA